jgi:hypothetical protein
VITGIFLCLQEILRNQTFLIFSKIAGAAQNSTGSATLICYAVMQYRYAEPESTYHFGVPVILPVTFPQSFKKI